MPLVPRGCMSERSGLERPGSGSGGHPITRSMYYCAPPSTWVSMSLTPLPCTLTAKLKLERLYRADAARLCFSPSADYLRRVASVSRDYPCDRARDYGAPLAWDTHMGR